MNAVSEFQIELRESIAEKAAERIAADIALARRIELRRRNESKVLRGELMLAEYSYRIETEDAERDEALSKMEPAELYSTGAEVLRDLLVDLMHFAHKNKIDFLDVQALAQCEFQKEISL